MNFAIACALALSASVPLQAQAGSFIAMLGSDTMQVERYERRAGRVEGIVATRSPVTRVIRYSLTFDAAGRPLRYEVAGQHGDGTRLMTNGAAGSMTLSPDTVTRETLRDGNLTIQRIAAPFGVVPGPGLPFLGTPYLLYELAHAQARRIAEGQTEAAWYLLTMNAQQMQPQRVRVWLMGADSAESDYFGVARIGYKFDEQGRLLRSDWSQTTYKYSVRRVAALDVMAIAREWDARDRSGGAMGLISPPDTVRATVGGASLTLTYSRPSKRGRVIWGGLVPWDQVWRLGADVATHFTTSTDLTIGHKTLPAGRYTLWMLPSQRGDAILIVNSATNIFGTQYRAATDLLRIPLLQRPLANPVERLTISIEAATLLIRWDVAEYAVPLKAGPP